MIKISFSSAIAIYLFFSLFLVFVLWMFYNYYRSGIHNESKYLQQCPYCTYIFFNYNFGPLKAKNSIKTGEKEPLNTRASKPSNGQNVETLVCPRCQSYINLEAANENKDIEKEC